MLMTSVDRFGDLNCFGYIPAPGMPRTHLSYNEFGDLATAVGKQLAAVGVKSGDRVALILNNSVEWAALSYGANGIGAAYTAMYTHQHGTEWAYILNDSTPALLAVADTAVLDKLVANMPGDASGWPSCGILLLGDEPANELPPEGVAVHAWADFVAAGRQAEMFEIADDPFALNTLIYTSGTTGNPKGVMLSNWNTLSNILCVQSAFTIYVGDKNAAFLPWAHSFGSTFDLHWMIRCGVHINLISTSPRLPTSASRSSPPCCWPCLVFGTSSTTVSTHSLRPPPASRRSSSRTLRSPPPSASPRPVWNATPCLPAASSTSCGTSSCGPRSAPDSAATFASACPVLLPCLPTWLRSSRWSASTATKATA